MTTIAAKGEIFSYSRVGSGSPQVTPLVKLFDGLLDWLDREHDRAVLARLDDRALKDIGLYRSDLGSPGAAQQ